LLAPSSVHQVAPDASATTSRDWIGVRYFSRKAA
jgi:hypothetical protein